MTGQTWIFCYSFQAGGENLPTNIEFQRFAEMYVLKLLCDRIESCHFLAHFHRLTFQNFEDFFDVIVRLLQCSIALRSGVLLWASRCRRHYFEQQHKVKVSDRCASENAL